MYFVLTHLTCSAITPLALFLFCDHANYSSQKFQDFITHEKRKDFKTREVSFQSEHREIKEL